ncbi:MAG: tetratricopeptide repeat protein, partial [Hyphomonas sp.]
AGLRALVAAFPQAEPPYRLLYGLLVAQGRADEARAVLDAALAAQPESPTFLFLKAEVLQRAGDIEGAIAVYEDLYARNSANPVIANNLASLITTFRDDAESLERASAIARRLRGSTVPAFADTYGWIELRRGNIAEAIAHLEPAARGLPDDPLVQYHLGMAYAAADRREEAVAQLT